MGIVIRRAEITPTRAGIVAVHTKAVCGECYRVFDMENEIDAQEWHYGHDCEA